MYKEKAPSANGALQVTASGLGEEKLAFLAVPVKGVRHPELVRAESAVNLKQRNRLQGKKSGSGVIDFKGIDAAARGRMGDVLKSLLPEGKVSGVEFKASVREDDKTPSFSFNLNTHEWADFGAGQTGRDAVGAVAYARGVGQGEAAKLLSEMLGLSGAASAHPVLRSVKGTAKVQEDEWTAVLPVDSGGAQPPVHPPRRHPTLGGPAATWTYYNEAGDLLCFVNRFDKPDDKKIILPLVQFRSPAGALEWRWKHPPEPKPLYGLDRLAARPEAPVLILEGEKTADAAHKLLPDWVAVSWMGGSNAVGKGDFKPLQGRKVFLWPDNDEAGSRAMKDVAGRLVEVGAAEVWTVELPGGLPKGWDLADRFPDGWTGGEDVAAWIGEHAKAATVKKSKPTLPRGYISNEKGLFFLEETRDGGTESVWVCSRIDVLAKTRNADSEDWGRLIEIIDDDGKPHRWAMPMALMAGKGCVHEARLRELGLRINPTKGRTRLDYFLNEANPEARCLCVSRLGWHGSRFVMPDVAYGKADGEEVVFQGNHDGIFKTAGNLDQWKQEIGRLCVGNSRLAFAVSAALAAPLLGLVDQESGGFHFVGGSSTGKTTALQVAGSVAGGGGLKGFIRSWRATANGLEGVAAQHNDLPLVLDEIGQISGKDAEHVGYLLGNGSGKSRARVDGSAKKAATWRTLFLSSGEETLADKVRANGGDVKAGQLVRILDIPADAGAGMGLFEALHGFDGPGALVQHLKAKSAQFYGAALRAFIEKIAQDPAKAGEDVRRVVGEVVERICPAGADGQVRRAAERFGLVAVAGELGVEIGILPWPEGEAAQSAARCFGDWLFHRGHAGSHEIEAAVDSLRTFIEANGSSRFEEWDGNGGKVINRAGWRRKVGEGPESVWTYYLLPSVMKREIAKGANVVELGRVLAERGLIKPGAEGKSSSPERIPGQGRIRVYRVQIGGAHAE